MSNKKYSNYRRQQWYWRGTRLDDGETWIRFSTSGP